MMAEKQAELIDEGLTTKADIEAQRIAAKADLAETKAEILKWMFSAIGFQTFVLLGALFALLRIHT